MARPLHILRGITLLVLAWIYVVIHTSIFTLVSLLTWRKFNHWWLPLNAHLFGHTILWMCGIKLEIEGQEYLSFPTPRVVIFTHQSLLDFLWLCAILPPGAVVVTKKEFMYIPFVNLAIWAAGSLFIDRKNHKRALRTIEALPSRILRERLSLFMAPEGTRSPSGEILQFKKGPFRVASSQNIPLYPVVVHGAFELLPKNRVLPRTGTIRVRCLPPVPTTDWQQGEIESHITDVRSMMIKTFEELGNTNHSTH